jgi:hypothetical protein
MDQLGSEHPLDECFGHLRQQAFVAHDRLGCMSAFADQYVQRFIERFVFLRFGSSHLCLCLGLTPHTNFLTGSAGGTPFVASGIPFVTGGIPFGARGISFASGGIPFAAGEGPLQASPAPAAVQSTGAGAAAVNEMQPGH